MAVAEALIGVVAGMRSALPGALLLRAARRDGREDRLPGPVGRGPLGGSLPLAAIGELVADKLPATPSRLDPGPFGGRLVSGALAGMGLARLAGRSPVTGGLLGTLGAAAGAYAGYQLRRLAVARTGLPDPAVAVAEDALAVGLGLLAVRPRA